MNEQTIRQRIDAQRDFFATGATLSLSFRLKQLEKLKDAISHYENDLYAALKTDLGKSRTESYMCEIGMTLSELTSTCVQLEEIPLLRISPAKYYMSVLNVHLLLHIVFSRF